jgi:Arc/MetJ-type ribon-helix-helix transcriptional regulator
MMHACETAPDSMSAQAGSAVATAPLQDLQAALALAVVSSKRRYASEAEALRTKVARLEERLDTQSAEARELRAWASHTLHLATAPASVESQQAEGMCSSAALPLPPLSGAGCADACPDDAVLASYNADSAAVGEHCGTKLPAAEAALAAVACKGRPLLASSYARVQQQQEQLETAMRDTDAGSSGGAAVQALSGKAALLSSMLHSNICAMVWLQRGDDGTDVSSSADAGIGCAAKQQQQQTQLGSSRVYLPEQSRAVTIASVTAQFACTTLLQVPASSLRAAYMQHTMCMLAASLVEEDEELSNRITREDQDVTKKPLGLNAAQPEAGGHITQLYGCHQHSSVVTARLLQLFHMLICTREAGSPWAMLAGGSNQEQGSPPSAQSGAAASSSEAAAALLEQASQLPSTALLAAVAAAQHLKDHTQWLRDAACAAAACGGMALCVCAALDAPAAAAEQQLTGQAGPHLEASAVLLAELVCVFTVYR